MAMVIVDNELDPDKWDFLCEVPGCGFESRAHTTKTLARDRGKEHAAEHESGEAMREIVEFDMEHGQFTQVAEEKTRVAKILAERNGQVANDEDDA